MTKKITEELALEIKEEFIFGVEKDDGVRQYPSIDTLVKKHGVARASLYRWAEKQDWQAEKNRVQTQISTQIEQDRVKRMVNESKKLDDNVPPGSMFHMTFCIFFLIPGSPIVISGERYTLLIFAVVSACVNTLPDSC